MTPPLGATPPPRRSIAARRHIAAALGVALVLGACGSAQSAELSHAASASGSGTSTDVARPPAPARGQATPAASSSDASGPTEPDAAAICEKVERPPLQSGSHLLGDQAPPVPYSSQPPTSGWHSSGHFDVDVSDADDPLSEPDQVSVLEADGVVVAHHALSDDAVAALGDHVRETLDGRVAVTPYDKLEAGQVVFTSWGVLQRCDGVDLAALDRFVQQYGTDEPIEPGH